MAADSADHSREREALTALTRELDVADRVAARAATAAPQEATRYHLDYQRLRDDLARVRAGVQNYLTPPRAQPRDPLPLSGDYVREGATPEPR